MIPEVRKARLNDLELKRREIEAERSKGQALTRLSQLREMLAAVDEEINGSVLRAHKGLNCTSKRTAYANLRLCRRRALLSVLPSLAAN
jgi:hypothetical protein